MAYQTAAELRAAVPVLDKTSTVSDDLLEELVVEFTAAVEHDHGVTYESVEITETHPGCRGVVLELRNRLVTDVDAISIDGVALSAGALADVVIRAERGALERSGGWIGDEITVTYTHGPAAVPAAVVRACREFVRARATKTAGNAPRDAAGPAGVDGTVYPTAATKPTGVRTADQILAAMRSYRMSGVVG